jgi:hypothetical protein
MEEDLKGGGWKAGSRTLTNSQGHLWGQEVVEEEGATGTIPGGGGGATAAATTTASVVTAVEIAADGGGKRSLFHRVPE